jgi:glucosamine kinase
LAGASEPSHLEAARSYPHPFHWAIITSDARAACIGAHRGRDGGIVIVGTGSIGWAIIGGAEHRVGGWGFPISDDGSGAWLGLEALRRSLWARDGLIPATGLSRAVLRLFEGNPHAVARDMHAAGSRHFASFAPLVVEQAGKGDRLAIELLESAARHIDAIAARLIALGASRLSLMGGLAGRLEPLVSEPTRSTLVPAAGDALSGALQLAREEADRLSKKG